MSRKTIYNKNISAPAEITNEEYESVGASKFQLGDSRRFFLGANDFEVYTEPSTGTKLVEGVDYQLLDLDANLSTLCAKPVFSSLIILNSEYQNCKLYLNYRCVLSQLDAKQMNAMQLQIDANKSLNETQSAILTDHELRITANTNKDTEQDSSIAEIIATNTIQDEAHAAHVSNSEIHVTAADKARWDGKANTHLVDNITARDALSGLNINDVVFVKDDGDGKRAGYYYNGAEASVLWEKFSDPDWENVSLEWSAIENVPQVLNDLADDGSGKLLYKGSAIGESGSSPDWTDIENVPQVLNDFSDDGTGLKYKGADIGTGGGESTPSPAVTNLVNNSKVFVDPVIYNTVLTNNATPLQWSAIANNGTDVYASIANYNAGGGAGIYKLNKSTGIFEIYYAHDQANIFGIACVGNDLYYCTGNGNPNGGYIYKQTNYTGDFVSLNVPIKYWTAMCTNGKDLYLAALSDDLYKLPNCTGNLVAQNAGVKNWSCVAANENDDVYAGVDMGDIYYKPSGSSIYTAMGQTSRSYSGLYVYNYDTIFACAQNEGIYVRANGYGNFAQSKAIAQPVKGVTVLNDTLYACAQSQGIYTALVVRGTDIYSTKEVPTNDYWLGHRVYRKVINFGALPNATIKSVAHGIPTPYTTKSVTGIASNGIDELTLPHTNPGNVARSIYAHIRRTDNTVVVGVGVDRSAYNAYITIEYIKANL